MVCVQAELCAKPACAEPRAVALSCWVLLFEPAAASLLRGLCAACAMRKAEMLCNLCWIWRETRAEPLWRNIYCVSYVSSLCVC